MTRARKFVATLACCVAASVALVGGASAGKSSSEKFHDEGSVVVEDFCGIAEVRHDFVVDGRFHAVPHGPDGFIYHADKIKETVVSTNLANGKTVTFVSTSANKELKVIDNGDGTLTIIEMGRGNDVLYGEDGRAIARNPGQVRVELLVDHGGTPTDSSDDAVIGFEIVKGSTGRSDDMCAAYGDALT